METLEGGGGMIGKCTKTQLNGWKGRIGEPSFKKRNNDWLTFIKLTHFHFLVNKMKDKKKGDGKHQGKEKRETISVTSRKETKCTHELKYIISPYKFLWNCKSQCGT